MESSQIAMAMRLYEEIMSCTSRRRSRFEGALLLHYNHIRISFWVLLPKDLGAIGAQPGDEVTRNMMSPTTSAERSSSFFGILSGSGGCSSSGQQHYCDAQETLNKGTLFS